MVTSLVNVTSPCHYLFTLFNLGHSGLFFFVFVVNVTM